MRRVLLFLVTNIAVMIVLSITASFFFGNFMTAQGLNLTTLLLFAAVLGFGGSFISLLISKQMAKWTMKLQMISPNTSNATERWVYQTVEKLAQEAKIGMPEVAIYDGAPNAFATGASRNKSLVAVSTGLLAGMTKEEVEAVMAHEVAHIANGDMVTLALIQGVVNTFVIFLARIVGYAVDQFLRRGNNEGGVGIGYYITTVVAEIVFGILASTIVMYFSRQREFRADAGSAYLMGRTTPMIAALRRLQAMQEGIEPLPASMAAAGITNRPSKWMALFSSHPSLESRIAVLEQRA